MSAYLGGHVAAQRPGPSAHGIAVVYIFGRENDRAILEESTFNRAQVGLCRELRATDGVLRDVDAGRVAQVSERMRHDYYQVRLAHPILGLDPSVTKRIIVEVDRRPIHTIPQLNALCNEVVARAGLAGNPFFLEIPPGGLARTLVEKGVVTITPQRGCEVAIPSMVDWAS